MAEDRNGAPGTTDQRPRWEGPPENRPSGYLPAKDHPAVNRDAAGENLRDPERHALSDAVTMKQDGHPSGPAFAPGTKRRLRGGHAMPLLGLGTWKLTGHTADTVLYALQCGYRMIDTSGDYGTQPGIGEAIRQAEIDRDDLYIVTKVEETDNVHDATRRCLDELGLERADLILLHRPPETGAGEDLWQGLIQTRDEGLADSIGVSNYSAEQITRLVDATGEMPAVNQIEWSPFGFSEQMLNFAEDNGILIQAYSPLTRATRLDDLVLNEIAMQYGKSPAQLLLRWNLQRGTVPLPKAARFRHVKENFDIFDFEIADADMLRLNRLNEGYSALGTLPY